MTEFKEYVVKVYEDGHKEWLLNGKLHREDGPAIEYSSGSKEWWLNGVGTPIFKDPKTDNGIKKSAKGLLMVTETNGVYGLVDQVSVDQERYGCLETVFKDGELVKTVTLADIRAITDREFI